MPTSKHLLLQCNCHRTRRRMPGAWCWGISSTLYDMWQVYAYSQNLVGRDIGVLEKYNKNMKLSNDQINIIIAEHCGWSHIVYDKYLGAFGESPKHEEEDVPIPDYCHDLNAMHDAEQTLSPLEFNRYIIQLERFTAGVGQPIVATAAQRAEAFCKVINKAAN